MRGERYGTSSKSSVFPLPLPRGLPSIPGTKKPKDKQTNKKQNGKRKKEKGKREKGKGKRVMQEEIRIGNPKEKEKRESGRSRSYQNRQSKLYIT